MDAHSSAGRLCPPESGKWRAEAPKEPDARLPRRHRVRVELTQVFLAVRRSLDKSVAHLHVAIASTLRA